MCSKATARECHCLGIKKLPCRTRELCFADGVVWVADWWVLLLFGSSARTPIGTEILDPITDRLIKIGTTILACGCINDLLHLTHSLNGYRWVFCPHVFSDLSASLLGQNVLSRFPWQPDGLVLGLYAMSFLNLFNFIQLEKKIVHANAVKRKQQLDN